jgi:hypothetical protein
MDFLKDLIAGVVVVEQRGQKLRPSEGVELERELDEILGGIREADDLRAADESLDRLGRFQTELARACFKWDIALPVRLRRLVRKRTAARHRADVSASAIQRACVPDRRYRLSLMGDRRPEVDHGDGAENCPGTGAARSIANRFSRP